MFDNALDKIHDMDSLRGKRMNRIKSPYFSRIPTSGTEAGSTFTANISYTGGKTLTHKGKPIPNLPFGPYAQGGLVTDMMENDILLGALR